MSEANGINQLVKLPAKDDKAAEGMRFCVLNFKTDKATKVKAASAAYEVPAHRPAVTGVSPQVAAMIHDLIDEEQKESVIRFHDGSLDHAAVIGSLELMAKAYFTDGRGSRNGVRQPALLEWINGEFAEYFKARIDRNLATQTEAQRAVLCESYLATFRMAASTNNRGAKDKVTGDHPSVSLQRLKDLAGRLEVYSTDSSEEWRLPGGEELDCLKSRIAGHIAAIEKAMMSDEVSALEF